MNVYVVNSRKYRKKNFQFAKKKDKKSKSQVQKIRKIQAIIVLSI